MADFLFNIAKGRTVEFYNRAENNDPTNCAFVLVPFSASGTEAQGQDLDTLAAVEADANFAEITTNNWTRKVLESVQLAALPAPDDVNNRYEVSVPAVTWTTITVGGVTTGLLMCWDSDTTVGTDSDIIPLAHYTFAVTPNGDNVVLDAGPFYRGS